MVPEYFVAIDPVALADDQDDPPALPPADPVATNDIPINGRVFTSDIRNVHVAHADAVRTGVLISKRTRDRVVLEDAIRAEEENAMAGPAALIESG